MASASPVQGGDTIVVRSGTYSLASAINFGKSGSVGSPITLIAEAGVVLNVTASSLEDGALDLNKVHDVHVFNNTFVGNQRLGIHVDNPDIQNLFIRNNIIVNNGSPFLW